MSQLYNYDCQEVLNEVLCNTLYEVYDFNREDGLEIHHTNLYQAFTDHFGEHGGRTLYNDVCENPDVDMEEIALNFYLDVQETVNESRLTA
jgi:hypothetical protein